MNTKDETEILAVLGEKEPKKLKSMVTIAPEPYTAGWEERLKKVENDIRRIKILLDDD